ncbi:hypothetical protein C5F64_16100, partial [Photobacterium damselae subsp. damselae]
NVITTSKSFQGWNDSVVPRIRLNSMLFIRHGYRFNCIESYACGYKKRSNLMLADLPLDALFIR